MKEAEMRTEYSRRYSEVLSPISVRLQRHLDECFVGVARIDRVSVRAKSIDRFVEKAIKKDGSGACKYADPLSQIQDQVGARVVCFYLSDVEAVSEVIMDNFRRIEERTVVPETTSAFGYFGKHYVLFYPDEVIDDENPPTPRFFELQIKTLFQHAWSEAEHDLFYKKKIGEIGSDVDRKIAFTAAQSWGADQIFDELFRSARGDTNSKG